MKNTIKRKIVYALLLSVVIPRCLYAQTPPSVKEPIISFFYNFQMLPQDKLYLHLDKPYYGAGEAIWFKGYLLSAVTHKDDRKSNYITVELVNRMNSVVATEKIKREGEIFQGRFILPADLVAGEYYIRAYSNWMLNWDECFFYNRKIKIGNAIDAESAAKENKKRQKASSTDYHVTFFPEGGDLLNLPNKVQMVAFKVQGEDGFSKEVTGFVLDERKDTLAVLKTQHDGMGSFPLNAMAGKRYYAETLSADGVSRRFELPAVRSQGIKIAMVRNKGTFIYQILKAANTSWPDSLHLVAHTRGQLQFVKYLSPTDTIGRISESSLDDGITHFLLVDGKGTALSERLVFVYHKNQPKWLVATDQPSYGKREKVSMDVALTDETGNPLSGNFSMSVTDNSVVKIEPSNENILSNILLTSDLKGYIENPGFYLQEQTRFTEECLNLLMLTHGWRRFEVKNVFTAPRFTINNFVEAGQVISGRVKGFFGNNAKGALLSAHSKERGLFYSTKTNEKGEFMFEGVDFPDSTTFEINARSKKGSRNITIEIDQPDVPAPKAVSPFTNDSLLSIKGYLETVKDDYFNSGGMRIINLQDVVITEKRKDTKSLLASENSFYKGLSDYTVKGEDVTKTGGRSLYDLIQRLPGVMVSTNHKISLRGNPNQPVIVVDGVPYDNASEGSFLSTIMLDMVEQVDLIKGAGAAIFGMNGGGGAIIVSLKSGANIVSTFQLLGKTTISPKGYSQTVQFYEPVYATPEQKSALKPDLRTTIYWNPKLKIDATGKANVEFYTNDIGAPQHVVIEGVTTEGKVCRYSRDL